MIKKVVIVVKYNVISYLIGEGFGNVFKNKKSTAASLIIMCATMLVFGLFFVIGENVNHMVEEVEEAQGIQVFIKNETTDEQVKELESKIKEINGVNTENLEFISKEDALNQMKERFGDKSYLLEGYAENNIFPASYIVTLNDLTLSKKVQSELEKIDNVKEVKSRDQTISTIISLANGVRITTFVLLIILIVIAIFIISNTIKLTVHARRKEISIMKYVGATNNFIRWPFIVEGIIIGILAGGISILLVGGAYNIVAEKMSATSFMQNIGMNLLSFNDMFTLIVTVYLILGIGIGILGSSISMRKYLKV